MYVLFEILFVLSLSVPSAILKGFVLSELWGWFIVPLGVVQISIVNAIGIYLILNFLSSNNGTKSSKDRTERIGEYIGRAIVPLFAWGFGAIVHLFM